LIPCEALLVEDREPIQGGVPVRGRLGPGSRDVAQRQMDQLEGRFIRGARWWCRSPAARLAETRRWNDLLPGRAPGATVLSSKPVKRRACFGISCGPLEQRLLEPPRGLLDLAGGQRAIGCELVEDSVRHRRQDGQRAL